VNHFIVTEFLDGASKNVVAQVGGLSMIISVGKKTHGAKSFGALRERFWTHPVINVFSSAI